MGAESRSSAATGGAAGIIDLLPAGRQRRLLHCEVLIVLGLSLGQSAVYSVLQIADRLTRAEVLSRQTTSMNVSRAADRPWLDLSYQLANVTFGLVPVLLALYLLLTVRVPSSGVSAAVGTAPSKPLQDWIRGVLLAAAIGIPGLAFYLFARWLGINTTVAAANLTSQWWTTPVLVAAAAMNAFLEEFVMIGYLFTRWRQVAWKPVTILVTSAVLRGTYHLYQGFGGFLGNIIMGLILGLVFLRTRRVWPLVIAHFLLDVFSFVGYSLLKPHVSWL